MPWHSIFITVTAPSTAVAQFSRMKCFLLSLSLLITTFTFAQTLPIDFENDVTTNDFIDFDGGIATVIANPQSGGINTSATVAQIVRNGGQIYAGSKIILDNNLDLSTNAIFNMKVFTTAPVGTVVKFKLEGGAVYEVDQPTTVSGQWETLQWDFTGVKGDFNTLVFMFDYGNVGNGSATSTFLFDDIELTFGGTQIDLPVTFQSSTVNYSTTDFGGNVSALIADPDDASNTVVEVIKTATAATWAGTTIGTPTGFASDIPLTMTDSVMTVRVWSPAAGVPVRLKVEDANANTHTCETEAVTTVAAGWEVLTFDFTEEAPGTAALATGLSNGWVYNMASIFFNFGTDGATAGEQTYYFDNVAFGEAVTGIERLTLDPSQVFPNPAIDQWTIVMPNVIPQVVLTNMAGQQVRTLSPQSNRVQIDASDLSPGIYVAQLFTLSGEVITATLIKK